MGVVYRARDLGFERDVAIKIVDTREADIEENPQLAGLAPAPVAPSEFPPPTTVAGLMREMVLVAELGKSKGIPGYRRSNKFSGETVLADGTMNATVDEIFMGTDYWGYVLTVENKLDTSQRINPATFRIDGTRAISANKWELSPVPLTDEQKITQGHRGKVYIVTRSKRS